MEAHELELVSGAWQLTAVLGLAYVLEIRPVLALAKKQSKAVLLFATIVASLTCIALLTAFIMCALVLRTGEWSETSSLIIVASLAGASGAVIAAPLFGAVTLAWADRE